MCLQSLVTIVKFNAIFRDVYREVGVCEFIFSSLSERLHKLSEAANATKDEQQVTELLAECCYLTLVGPNNANCMLFHDSPASKLIFTLLPTTSENITKSVRKQAFLIMQQLILSNCGEEHLANVLTLMHNTLPIESNEERRRSLHLTTAQEISLRANVLKLLLVVLRESHRCRALFRKIGGFVYVMSVLVGMEGCLGNLATGKSIEGDTLEIPSPEPDASQQFVGIPDTKIWSLLRLVFSTLTTAMRFEPANAKFFATEICPTSLTDSLRLLGCFTLETQLAETFSITEDELRQTQPKFDAIFNANLTDMPPKRHMDTQESACLIMRLLYEMALDLTDKQTSHQTYQRSNRETPTDMTESMHSDEGEQKPPTPKRPPSLALGAQSAGGEPPVIIHSSVVIAMVHLIPALPSEDLQCYLIESIRDILRLERNQQVMCEAGLVSEFLSDKYHVAILEERHPFHIHVQSMLERLAAQCVQPRELRQFLRLGAPLNCTAIDDKGKDAPKNFAKSIHTKLDGCSLPLTRIQSLVAMTSPIKESTPHKENQTIHLAPPFVEFDMSPEGFSCLFLPSISPLSMGGGNTGPTSILTGAISGDGPPQVAVNGGIGTGERPFPPQSGLSFLTWICVEKFSMHGDSDAHNVRLLTILRGSSSGQEFACLQIQIGARDKALLVSTQETPIFGDGDLQQPSGPLSFDADFNLRVWSPEFIQEGQWHHICVVLNRALLKNSSATVYIDGNAVAQHKLRYISSSAGGAANAPPASYVNG